MKVINLIYLIIIICFFNACWFQKRVHINDYYSGKVVDELDRPVKNVSVQENIAGVLLNKTITNENGYFRMNRSENLLPNLIFSKNGFITDTIPLVWHPHGEYTEYSRIITMDSAKKKFRRNNYCDLELKPMVFKPKYNATIKSKYSIHELKGIWLKNGDIELDGFKFDEKYLYVFGFDGYRYMSYKIIGDTLNLSQFSDGYYNIAKGIIRNVSEETLEIQWDEKKITKYKKYHKKMPLKNNQ